jgi:hypothetical protein
MELAREAMAVVRATDDPESLAYVLTRSWAMLDGSRPWQEEFGRTIREAESVAMATGELSALLDVNNFALAIAASVGDATECDTRLAAMVRLGDQMRRRATRAGVRWKEAQQAVYEGRLADGERLTGEGLELSVDSGLDQENVRATIGALFYAIRQAQGRLMELVPAIEDLVVAQPGIPTWRLALAGAFYEAGRYEEARPHWDWMAADECAVVRRDPMYPVNLCGLARMAYGLRPERGVLQYVYDALLPFAGIFNWTGGTLGEGNDTGLAMAAEALGRPDDTDRHQADSIALCERAGARAYLARAHFDRATVLADRGDPAGARPHLETAIAIGVEIGMTGPFGVVTRGTDLLVSLDAR